LKIIAENNLVSLSKITMTAMLLVACVHLALVVFARDPQVLQLASNLFNPLNGLLAAALMLLAARSLAVSWRRSALAWGFMGLAVAFSMLGDTAWMVLDVMVGQPATPSIADGFYLLFYVLFLVGVLLIPVKPQTWIERAKAAIDVIIVLLATFLGLWMYILGPAIVQSREQPLVAQIMLVIYPMADIFLLWAVLIILFLVPGYPRRRSLWALVSGLAVFIVSDIGYSFLSLQSSYGTGNWPDAGYSLAYLLLGLAGYLDYHAAVHQRAFTPHPVSDPPLWVRMLPYIWVVMAYWMLVQSMYWPEQVLSRPRVAMAVGLITLFVVLRQLISLHENGLLSKNLGDLLQQVKKQASQLELANREMYIEITERRKMAERLSYDALHDGLTGLPNRALLLDRLAQAARKNERQPSSLYSVMFLDLDGFKLVNDTLGHLLGDQLLIRVAGILRSCVRASDTVARLGGDEFVILVEDVTEPRSVEEMANRLQVELRRPLDLAGTPVYISTSIGIVTNVNEYERPEDLLRDADLAMYQAKSQGKARYVVFEKAMRAVAISRLALENDLRAALRQHEFFLEYQPVFELASRRPVGFEALLRWQHPERGRLEPSSFVGVAEDAGLMLQIGEWCLAEACRQAVAWQQRFEPFGPLKMGVNISGQQFHDAGFVNMVRNTLWAAHLPGESLLLEVPENICQNNIDSLRSAMSDLRSLGVEIQIDDFGTGYSSLGYLRSLPVRAVKIDRTFVEPINSLGDPRAPEIVRAILAMMRSLGVETCAEGIETGQQLDALVRMGCQRGQGYYLAKPMLAADLEIWMETLAEPV
jgi:diguanylate cyclase